MQRQIRHQALKTLVFLVILEQTMSLRARCAAPPWRRRCTRRSALPRRWLRARCRPPSPGYHACPFNHHKCLFNHHACLLIIRGRHALRERERHCDRAGVLARVQRDEDVACMLRVGGYTNVLLSTNPWKSGFMSNKNAETMLIST